MVLRSEKLDGKSEKMVARINQKFAFQTAIGWTPGANELFKILSLSHMEKKRKTGLSAKPEISILKRKAKKWLHFTTKNSLFKMKADQKNIKR